MSTAEESEQKRTGGRLLLHFLNTPFAITVLGGICVTVVSSVVAHQVSLNERQREEQRAIREKKMAILSNLDHDVDRFVSLRLSVHKMRFWLRDHREDEKLDGIPYPDVEKNYVEFYKLLMSTRTADSSLREVGLFFSKESATKAEDLMNEMDDMFALTKWSEMSDPSRLKTYEKQMKELGHAMTSEIGNVQDSESN